MTTVAEAARHLGVSDRRVRALIASGALAATRVGRTYLLSERDVDSFRLRSRPAHVRAMSPRVAWAAAAMADGTSPVWLRSDERSRLRSRLAAAPDADVWQAWVSRRAAGRLVLRGSAAQVAAVLADASTVRTGGSATNVASDRLVGPVAAEVWVASLDDAERLRRSLALLRTSAGNIVIHVPPAAAVPLLGADGENAFRLVVASDLLADDDPRASAAGAALLDQVVADVKAWDE